MPPEKYDFQYSDGDDTENYILNAIRQSADLSTGSSELFAWIRDWPSLYHLSPKRADLLRPLTGLLSNKKILEIGSGCGAITRFLGETCTEVLALEGSIRRAAITRERCRDLQNVTVVADNFEEFTTGEHFDGITLIGVLEYSNLFIKGDNPPLAMLRKIMSMLNPGGFVIIAIENKLGLKYLAGTPEDHLGVAFAGIENRYDNTTAVTFGKKELSQVLHSAGLETARFLYPFPDYKLPVTIITERGLQHPGFDVPGLLLEKQEYVQGISHSSLFNLSLAQQGVYANALTADLANSFLVVAGSGNERAKDGGLLAASYSTSRRKAFCKSTEFRADVGDRVTIRKKKLYHETIDDAAIRLTLEEEAYRPGVLLQERLVRIVSVNNWTLDQLVGWAREYFSVLQQNASSPDGKYLLDGKFIDLTPFNIIMDAGNKPFIFDQEWDAGESIPIGYVFFRGIYYSLGQVVFFSVPEQRIPRCLLECSTLLLKNFSDNSSEAIDEFRKLEKSKFSKVWPKDYEPFKPEPMRIREFDRWRAGENIEEGPAFTAVQPLPFIHTQVYWADENGNFSEEHSVTKRTELSAEATKQVIDFGQDLSQAKRMRVDPCAQPGVFYLHSLSVVDPQGKIIVDWANILSGCTTRNLVLTRSSIQDNTFMLVSFTNDPIIEFELPFKDAGLPGGNCSLLLSASSLSEATLARELEYLSQGELTKLADNFRHSLNSYFGKLQSSLQELKDRSDEWQAEKIALLETIASKEELIRSSQEAAKAREVDLQGLQEKLNEVERTSILRLIKNRLLKVKK